MPEVLLKSSQGRQPGVAQTLKMAELRNSIIGCAAIYRLK